MDNRSNIYLLLTIANSIVVLDEYNSLKVGEQNVAYITRQIIWCIIYLFHCVRKCSEIYTLKHIMFNVLNTKHMQISWFLTMFWHAQDLKNTCDLSWYRYSSFNRFYASGFVCPQKICRSRNHGCGISLRLLKVHIKCFTIKINLWCFVYEPCVKSGWLAEF